MKKIKRSKKRKMSFAAYSFLQSCRKNASSIIFVLIAFLISCFFALAIFISKVQIIDNTVSYVNGYSAVTVISGSMEPTLHVGDIAIIKKCDSYTNGDIITFFTEDEQIYTHRIVSDGYGKFKTQGDANNTMDDFIVYEPNIVGKVMFKIPFLGKFIATVAGKIAGCYMFLLVLVIFILFSSVIYDIVIFFVTDFTDEEKKVLEEDEYKKYKSKILRKVLIYKIEKKMKKG